MHELQTKSCGEAMSAKAASATPPLEHPELQTEAERRHDDAGRARSAGSDDEARRRDDDASDDLERWIADVVAEPPRGGAEAEADARAAGDGAPDLRQGATTLRWGRWATDALERKVAAVAAAAREQELADREAARAEAEEAVAREGLRRAMEELRLECESSRAPPSLA